MRREIGHNLEPAPPDKIMGIILVVFLITSEQIPCENLVFNVFQFIDHAVGNYLPGNKIFARGI